MDKDAEYYMSLPYTREIVREPDGKWFVQIKELPGCVSQGDTLEEALRMIEDAMRGWLEVELEDGASIPEPRDEEEYSGKFVVRVPKSLHRRMVELAERDGVSLNQWINVSLALTAGNAVMPVHQNLLTASSTPAD
jgi:antitoxin HicB